MRNSPPNVENVGLFSTVPPGQTLSLRRRKTFLMVTLLSRNRSGINQGSRLMRMFWNCTGSV